MKAFSNENIIDKLCGGCDCTGFAAAVTYVYDAEAKTVVATDGSTYPAGADRSVVHITVYDKFGNKALGSIASDDGDDAITVSVADLDASEGLTILATVVSDDGCLSDGHASNIGSAGSLGSWDKDNDTISYATASES